MALDQVAHEANAGPRYFSRVIVRSGFAAHPGHVAGTARQDLHAVALAAGHVHHMAAHTAFRHPLVHGQVAPEPVVLDRHVRKRPLAGELQRRHPSGWALCTVSCTGGVSLGTRLPLPMQSAESIRDANVRYHDIAAEHYDLEGIKYDRVGQAQVTGKLRKALDREPGRYERALEIGAGTGYFTLNLLGGGVIGEAVATDISPGMLERLERSRRSWVSSVETAACEAAELPFEDDSFDLVFGHAILTTSPTSTPRSANSFACRGREAWHVLRRALLLRRPHRRRRSAAPTRWRSAGAAGAGRRPPSNGNGNGGFSEETGSSRWWTHAFTPADQRRMRRRLPSTASA